MNEKIKRLKFEYKPNNVEEIDSMLMHANDLLKYRDVLISAFEKSIFFFLFEQVKEESKNAFSEFVAEEEVSKFIQKIKSLSKNINLSLFNEFFESSPVDYAKYLINLKNKKEIKEFATEAESRISSLKDNKRNERKRKKEK